MSRFRVGGLLEADLQDIVAELAGQGNSVTFEGPALGSLWCIGAEYWVESDDNAALSILSDYGSITMSFCVP